MWGASFADLAKQAQEQAQAAASSIRVRFLCDCAV